MPSQKTKEVTLLHESQDFPRTMFYNRFYVERSGPVRIFYFGLLDDEDYVRDAYACAIDEEAIERHREDILDYVARAPTGTPSEEYQWRPKVTAVPQIQLANLIRASRSGNLAEMRLFNYAMGEAIDAMRKDESSIQAIPIAMLRCEETVQRAMFLAMYAGRPIAKDAKTKR
jgi:hypothetical protein